MELHNLTVTEALLQSSESRAVTERTMELVTARYARLFVAHPELSRLPYFFWSRVASHSDQFHTISIVSCFQIVYSLLFS
jgi:hypothetical protein